MVISITRAVKKYLRPVMEEHGYRYTGAQMGCWDFEKRGRRVQNVFVQRCMGSKLRLEFRLSPSFRHKHMELEESYLKRFLLYRGFGRDWFFESQEDVEQIVKCFAQIMEEKGFDMMEQADGDPLDVVPTPQMQERLFAEHQALAEKFLRDNGLESWDHSNFIPILAPRLLACKERVFEGEDEEEILQYASAYGLVFERMGGVWRMENGQCLLEIRLRDRHLPFSVYPLTAIFHTLHFGKPDNLLKLLELNIPYVLQNCIPK